MIEQLKEIMSCVPVIAIRTREPYKTQEIFHKLAKEKDNTVYQWEVHIGLQEYDYEYANRAKSKIKKLTESNFPEVYEDKRDLVHLFLEMRNYLVDSTKAKSSHKYQPGVYLFHYPQLWLSVQKPPGLIQTLKELIHRVLRQHKITIVFLVPYNFELPTELEEDIPIIDVSLPDQYDLYKCLSLIIESFSQTTNTDPCFTPEQEEKLCEAGKGLTEYQFESAVFRSLYNLKENLNSFDFIYKKINNLKIELINKSEALTFLESESIDSVGGLDNLKEYLLMEKSCLSSEGKNLLVEPSRGILLVGNPGTGKTLTAKCAAGILNLPLINMDIGSIYTKFVGESEQRMRSLLSTLEALSPCVLLIDEIDKCFSDIGSGMATHNTKTQILSYLLKWMDKDHNIFVILTANRAQDIPSELTRHGRLDRIFSVLLPNETERKEIIKIHCVKRCIEFDSDEIASLAKSTEGYSSSEIESAVKMAIKYSYYKKEDLSINHIVTEIQNIIPLSKSRKEDYQYMVDWCSAYAYPASAEEVQPIRRKRIAVIGESQE